MSSVIKCSTCNVVIDELLSFVQNKISVMDDDSLIQILKSSFKSEEIKRSKSLLFESLPTEKRKITRKNAGKEVRDLEDIISLFRESNVDMRPVFVARDLEKLPPVTFDHLDVTKMLKELVLLQTAMKDFRTNYVTKDQLGSMMAEILKQVPPLHTDNLHQSSPSCWRSINVNACCTARQVDYSDSGPIGLSHLDTSLNDNTVFSPEKRDREQTSVEYPPLSSHKNKVSERAVVTKTAAVNVISERETGLSKAAGAGGDQLSVFTSNVSVGEKNSKNYVERIVPPLPPVPLQVIRSEQKEEAGWNVVHYRKPKLSYRYQSKTGSACDIIGKFKAADTKVPIFITNVHKDTTVKDITEYIREKTKENISLERIIMKEEKDHNAYKFFVSENKLSMFLNDSLWPKGILFRRFMHFKQRNAAHGTVPSVPSVNGR